MAVLHDLPFVVITLLSGVSSMHFLVIELALPLWIAQETSVPRYLVAVTLMINTVCVVQMGLAPRERQGQYQGFAGVGPLLRPA